MTSVTHFIVAGVHLDAPGSVSKFLIYIAPGAQSTLMQYTSFTYFLTYCMTFGCFGVSIRKNHVGLY